MSIATFVLGTLGLASLFGLSPDASIQEVFACKDARAGVLVLSSDNHGDYVILARETQGIRKKGTYDIFGGKKEKGDVDAAATAAREWWQEGLGLFESACTIKKAQESLADNSLVKDIIINPQNKYITFVIRLDASEVRFVGRNFSKKYHQLCKAKSDASQIEKDTLALVSVDALKKAIATNNGKVIALVFDANGILKRESITIRARLLRNLKKFAE